MSAVRSRLCCGCELATRVEAVDRTNPLHNEIVAVEEDPGAMNIDLTGDDIRSIGEAASKIPLQGERLPPALLKWSWL
jgi:hypothetical protein